MKICGRHSKTMAALAVCGGYKKLKE